MLVTILLSKVIGPEEALNLFEKATIAWINNKTFQALEYMKLAMEGEIYLEDIPEFWYMLSRIELELGMVEEAKEALMNVLILDPGRSEIVTLLNTIDMFQENLIMKNTISYAQLFESFDGLFKGYEYFYSPVSVDSYGSNVIVLDAINSRLVFLKKDFYSVYKLPVKKPNSLKVDSTIHVAYYTDPKNGNIRKFNLLDLKDEGILVGGFTYPVIFDVDQAGRLLIYDSGTGKLYVLSHSGKKLVELSLDRGYNIAVINGAVFNYEKIYVQDLSNRSYKIFNTLTGKQLENIPFPSITSLPVTFDVDERGGIISLWTDGKFRYIFPKAKPIDISVNFDTSGINLIRYFPPFLFCSDIKKHKIYKFLLNTEKANYLVSISSYNINQNTVTVDFSLESLLGGYRIPGISPFLYVFDSKGRVGFDYTEVMKKPSVMVVNRIKDFFKDEINTLKCSNRNYVILRSDEMNKLSVDVSNVIIQSKLKNVTYYLTTNMVEELDESIVTLVHATGGIIVKEDYLDELKKYLSLAKPLTSRVKYTHDFSVRKIRSISIQLNIGEHTYSDTVYYVGGLNLEGTSK